jgi:4-hydroxy-tetrahydrodipicolinate reductase
MIKVLVNGAKGKMGVTVLQALRPESDMEIVGDAEIYDKLEDAIKLAHPDVVVDFTHPQSVYENTKTILQNNCHAVIGTTGLTPQNLKEIAELAQSKQKCALVCPNFSISAVLMMLYAEKIAKYMSSVEIIEMHHAQKIDAPSGTSLKTAEMIAKINPDINNPQFKPATSQHSFIHHNIPIHSVRLPGLLAHQEVIFGDAGQTLIIRQDSLSRESFMPGVMLGIRKAIHLQGLVYGLENILD